MQAHSGFFASEIRSLVAATVIATLAACSGPLGIPDDAKGTDGPSAATSSGPPTRGLAPSVVVDGDHIAFVRDGRGMNPDIYVMNADGSDTRRLTNDGLWSVYPAWSPDHRRLAFDGSGDIYTIDVVTLARVRLTSDSRDDWWPAWSPDGRKIAFTRDVSNWFDWEIFVMNADGTDFVRLTFDTGGDKPTWSPDGSRIAFGSGDIYVMEADGSNLRSLTDGPGWDYLPSWSPDGTRIAFTRSTTEGDGKDIEVWVVDADGSNPVNLTRHDAYDQEPTWSPDGERIAFSTNRDGNYEIYVMGADGSDPVRLTWDPESDSQPAWWR